MGDLKIDSKHFTIKKGRDIPIVGAAGKSTTVLSTPEKAAIQPADFRGIKGRLQVNVGDAVKIGSTILTDKSNPDIKIVAPVSGKIIEIKRGQRRSLQQIIINSDGKNDKENIKKIDSGEVDALSRDDIIQIFLQGGLWPLVRQRPFSRVADPHTEPKAIFIQGMNTEPLAADIDFVVGSKKELFQFGIDIIRKLTSGNTYLCIDQNAASDALVNARGVSVYKFSGPHPAGNVSTHVHHIDPINKGEFIWYLSAHDVLVIAQSLQNGYFSPKRTVILTGEGADENKRCYYETVIGASVKDITAGCRSGNQLKYISGSILSGTEAGEDGFLGFYATQLHLLPDNVERHFLGWMNPGGGSFSMTKMFLSSFMPARNYSFSSDEHGSLRAIVLNDVYDSVVPLDIMVFFLVRAVLAGDIDEAEALGILECDEEDFALCSFMCPSKVDISGIIRRGLDMIEKEEAS